MTTAQDLWRTFLRDRLNLPLHPADKTPDQRAREAEGQ